MKFWMMRMALAGLRVSGDVPCLLDRTTTAGPPLFHGETFQPLVTLLSYRRRTFLAATYHRDPNDRRTSCAARQCTFPEIDLTD